MAPEYVEIVVKGRLSPELASELAGFEVSNGAPGFTHLRGYVTDQGGLLGLLGLLGGLNIDIESVNHVPYVS